MVSLSSKSLDQSTVEVLSKGLYFVPSLSVIPVREFISRIEQEMWRLPTTEAEKLILLDAD